MGRKETSVTAARIIDRSIELNHARELREEQFIQLAEEKSACVSKGKRKIGKKQIYFFTEDKLCTFIWWDFLKYNYRFRIDKIKFISLRQNIHEKIQLKSGRLCNVTIDCQKFKNIPVYERGGKCI